MNIEPLESRIAPATFTFADVDGDFVTVKTSKGTDTQLSAAIMPFLAAEGLGSELQKIDLSLNPVFAGTSLSVTAKRTSAGGDGFVNVGYIDASAAGGGTDLDLGAVTIAGDLGRINAGDPGNTAPGVASLSAQSMGRFGISTQGAGGTLASTVTGALPSLKIKGDFVEARLIVSGGPDGKLGAVSIAGSIIGGGAANTGSIFSSGAMGAVKIGGDIRGGAGSSSGQIGAGADGIGSVTVGGSLIGGSGADSGVIFTLSGGRLSAVKIGRDIIGGNGAGTFAGGIFSDGLLTSVTVGGSLLGRIGDMGAQIFSTGDMGLVKVGRDLAGGAGDETAKINTEGRLAGVTIGGSVFGGAGSYQTDFDEPGQIRSELDMGAVKITGDLAGGAGNLSGSIFSDARLASATIGGSVRADPVAPTLGAGVIFATTSIGTVKIGGSILGGAASGTGVVSDGTLGNVTVGGSVVGALGGAISAGTTIGNVSILGSLIGGSQDDSGSIFADSSIGAVKIRGDIIGGSAASGRVFTEVAGGTIASVTVGGSLLGGSGDDSGTIRARGVLGAVTVRGDVRGGGGLLSGQIGTEIGGIVNITSVTIGGSLIGGTDSGSGVIFTAGSIGAVKIGGNVQGSSLAAGAGDLDFTGAIEAGRIASLFIGGSIRTGVDESGVGALRHNASIAVANDIGPIVIKGSIAGATGSGGTTKVIITARGQLLPGATTDVAIKSLAVSGRVELAQILGGYTELIGSARMALNADAQIGAVTVGGDWIASDLVAGVVDGGNGFGNTLDASIAGGDPARIATIASIVIKGQALGTVAGADHFGFVSERIGSFKIGATPLPLQPGESNDLPPDDFALGATGDLRVREVL